MNKMIDWLSILGGYNTGQESSSEIYDPLSQSFLGGPVLPGAFNSFCAAKVNETHFAITGGQWTIRKFYMFNWNDETWTAMPDLVSSRYYHGCAVVNTEHGKELWLVGGFSGPHLDSVHIFDFTSSEWRVGVPMPQPRKGPATVVVDNKVVVIGGSPFNGEYLSSILEWNPDSNSWLESTARLSKSRGFAAATLVNDSGANCC